MRILLWHGYLLGGTGSNVYTRMLAREWSGAGHDVTVLSDEIYSRMSYGRKAVSITTFPGMLDKTIILDGFSKTYAMTGWRIGYGVMPPVLVEAVNRLMVNSNSCTASTGRATPRVFSLGSTFRTPSSR